MLCVLIHVLKNEGDALVFQILYQLITENLQRNSSWVSNRHHLTVRKKTPARPCAGVFGLPLTTATTPLLEQSGLSRTS